MKFSTLKQIVKEYNDNQTEILKHQGGVSEIDTKYSSRLSLIRRNIITKLDLRPSEYSKINDYEVGEPIEFSLLIKDKKLSLVNDIDIESLILINK